jgi:toxin ParE1/3/4
MVYQVRLTRRALRDLTHIYGYVQTEISERASSWFDGLEKAIYSLERYPERGPITPEDSKLRHLLYGRKPHVYRIIYENKKRSSRVDVLHIRHGARDKMPRR